MRITLIISFVMLLLIGPALATLSEARVFMTSATVGDVVAFAGGLSVDEHGLWKASAALDILNLTSMTWTTEQLSEARWQAAGVGHLGKLYFISGASRYERNGLF